MKYTLCSGRIAKRSSILNFRLAKLKLTVNSFQVRQDGEGRHQLALEHGAHPEERAGAAGEGAHEDVDERGRGGLPQARQREERPAARLPPLADRRVHRLADAAGGAAPGRAHEEEELQAGQEGQGEGQGGDERRRYTGGQLGHWRGAGGRGRAWSERAGRVARPEPGLGGGAQGGRGR